MKNLFIAGTLILGLFLTACSGEETTENSEAESTAMTCDELEKKADELEGEEVTVKAISWGNLGTVDGDVSMNLGDEKLEGMKQAHVVAKFSKKNADAANAIKKDTEVTIKATVGGVNYGAVELTNPSIVK